MGIYHTTGVSPLVPVIPDGFLSLGVERRKAGRSRKSYVLWEEHNVAPIPTLKIVSLTPEGEYDTKTPEELQRQTLQQLRLAQAQLERYRQQFGELSEDA